MLEVKRQVPLEVRQAEMKARWALKRTKVRSKAATTTPVIKKSRRKTAPRMAREFLDVYLKQIPVIEENINDPSSG
jgi:isocitrate dehydrogenase